MVAATAALTTSAKASSAKAASVSATLPSTTKKDKKFAAAVQKNINNASKKNAGGGSGRGLTLKLPGNSNPTKSQLLLSGTAAATTAATASLGGGGRVIVDETHENEEDGAVSSRTAPTTPGAPLPYSFTPISTDNNNASNSSGAYATSSPVPSPSSPTTTPRSTTTTTGKTPHKVDRFGFIKNMDASGNIVQANDNDNDANNAVSDDEEETYTQKNNNNNVVTRSLSPLAPLFAAAAAGGGGGGGAKTLSREHKWEKLIEQYYASNTNSTTTNNGTNRNSKNKNNKRKNSNKPPPRALLLKRVRKGVPHSMRGRVWGLLGDVPAKKAANPGLYDKLVRQTAAVQGEENGTSSSSNRDSQQQQDGQSLSSTAPQSQQQRGFTIQQGNNKQQHDNENLNYSKSFRSLQETIERDIHRTFPRHTLFYDDHHDSFDNGDAGGCVSGGAGSLCGSGGLGGVGESSMDDDDVGNDNGAAGLTCGTAAELSSMIRDLDLGQATPQTQAQTQSPQPHPKPNSANGHASPSFSATSSSSPTNKNNYATTLQNDPRSVLNAQGGQASLRRVLKAYSLYDREIGYCQGMNFIAGMLLTILPSEEDAFWLLVAVMNEPPRKMRGLFGEGMRETHQVLHVSERLIHQFLPRLAKHLDREHIHITMYATQWLLTQYTSSFRFDLVLRVWDCFLAEGWKITYRVMLALLQHFQSDLLKMSFEDILAFFRELPDRAPDGSVVVAHAMKIPLKRKHIAKYEKEWLSQHPH